MAKSLEREARNQGHTVLRLNLGKSHRVFPASLGNVSFAERAASQTTRPVPPDPAQLLILDGWEPSSMDPAVVTRIFRWLESRNNQKLATVILSSTPTRELLAHAKTYGVSAVTILERFFEDTSVIELIPEF
jgi:hypothetical protein